MSTLFKALRPAERIDWQRIIDNDCRDEDGDLVSIPPGIREHFDPPGYLVEQMRWEKRGQLTGEDGDRPLWVWAQKNDAGYPPARMITAGIFGTESMFQDQIAGSLAEARQAAWVHYDDHMTMTRLTTVASQALGAPVRPSWESGAGTPGGTA